MNFHIPGPESESAGVHLAPRARHFHSAHSPPSVHFKQPGSQPIDPSLGTGGAAPSSTGPPRGTTSASPLLRPHENGVSNGIYAETPKSAIAATPSTPSNSALLRSPNLPSRQTLPPFTPTDRSLPSRDVSDESVDEAYAAFILYCNPSFSLTTDTAELKRIFRQPPKSDGKSFSIWSLYELVKKYEEKEIKTWVELALELGVEKPALDKGQSTQKVQQYSVRLKRWMRAMHVDAFFDFLRGSPKEYYAHIPPPHDPNPEGGRDGVPIEEDLAIRALDPSLRPKRGRRKADDIEDDTDRAMTPEPKRAQPDGSIEFASPNNFAAPPSAYPDDFAPRPDPWQAASAVTPATMHPGKGLTPSSAHPSNMFRWRVNGTMDTPITPHPLSAVTPATANSESWAEEPQSAISTPKGNKSRRRHGPLVSSAWSSSASTQTGKLRGRPPSNRTVRDGPFSTFPANPKAKEATPIEVGKTPISSTMPQFPPLNIPQTLPRPQPGAESPGPQSATSTQPPTSAKRERLQLQVPQRVGGPVHLMTVPAPNGAPPTVLVNGEAARAAPHAPGRHESPPPRGPIFFAEHNCGEQHLPRLPSHIRQDSSSSHVSDFEHSHPSSSAPIARMTPPPLVRRYSHSSPKPPPPTFSAFSTEDLKRALAHELLRSSLTGRKRKRLRGHEAKGLAAAMINQIGIPSAEQAATYLGLAGELGGAAVIGARGMSKGEDKKIVCHRYRVGEDGYDSPIDEDDDNVSGSSDNGSHALLIRETWDVSWTLLLGGLSADCQLKGLVITSDDASSQRGGGGGGGKDMSVHNHQHHHHRGDEMDPAAAAAAAADEDWRGSFCKAQMELRAKEEEVRRLRDKVLDAVL